MTASTRKKEQSGYTKEDERMIWSKTKQTAMFERVRGGRYAAYSSGGLHPAVDG